jgi:hypothetical protein
MLSGKLQNLSLLLELLSPWHNYFLWKNFFILLWWDTSVKISSFWEIKKTICIPLFFDRNFQFLYSNQI